MSDRPYKVVAKDNYDRDHVSDRVIVENKDYKFARDLAEAMNNSAERDWYFVALPQDKPIYTFHP